MKKIKLKIHADRLNTVNKIQHQSIQNNKRCILISIFFFVKLLAKNKNDTPADPVQVKFLLFKSMTSR